MPLDFPSNPSNGQVYNNFYYDSTTNAWRSLGSAYAPNYLKNATFTTSSATSVPLTAQGIVSQSANLQEWKNSAGTTLSYINSLGNFVADTGLSDVKLNLRNPTAGTDQYLSAMTLSNDTGYKAIHFLNSSTRSTDGGTNAYTIRNDGGQLNLGNSSYNTNISGAVTMANQPSYFGYLNAYQSGTTSNYYPATTDVFNIGFSKSGNNRLTAQVAGKYYVAFQQLVNTAGVSVYAHIFKNGSTVCYGYSNGDDTYDLGTYAVINLAVNDYIEIYYGGSTTFSWGNPHSTISVFKVS